VSRSTQSNDLGGTAIDPEYIQIFAGGVKSSLSDLFTTLRRGPSYRSGMDIRVTSTVVEIVPNDLARALDFYRLLGLAVPDDPDGPHVEVELPGGNRLAFDTEEVIAGMHPGWSPPTSAGRLALAFGVDNPSEVDALFEKLTAAGHPGTLKPFDAPWGQRYATVTDPDGTSIDLFAALP
jgi:catechol 2,3-dioxygenase-like lactoylglutathione lyase family enzyme